MGSFEAIAEYLRRPNHLDQKDIQLTEREFNDLIPILRDAIRRPDRKLRTFTYDPMRPWSMPHSGCVDPRVR